MIDETALWTPVIIRGDPFGAIAAAKLLLPLLTTNPSTSEIDVNGNDVDSSTDMDDVVLDIPIYRSHHATIIGVNDCIPQCRPRYKNHGSSKES